MRLLIAIDDTDNLESRGTGWRSRQLARLLELEGGANAISVTRHQLLVHPNIPYTSHNSSACLEIESSDKQKMIDLSRDFLLKESAEGSDAGLCVIDKSSVHPEIETWGKRAKMEVLTMTEAYDLAKKHGLFLEGLTGEKTGIIGSMAGVGLHSDGNDGRFLLLGKVDLREYKGIMTAVDLKKMSGIDEIREKEKNIFASDFERIDLGDWMRPILINKKAVLFVEHTLSTNCEWKVANKTLLKQLSN